MAILCGWMCGVSLAQTIRDAEQYTTTPRIQFEEQSISIFGGVHPALRVVITGSEDSYSKHLKHWFENTFGLTGKRVNGLIVLPGAVLTAWSSDSLQVSYRVEKDGDQCALVLLAKRKNEFLSQKEHSAEVNAMQQSLKTQIKEYYIFRYDEVIADQQKEYERQRKDVEKTESKIAKLNNKIKEEADNINEADRELQNLSLKSSEVDQEMKLLHTTLQQDKKMEDQAQKELDQQNAIIHEKEVNYNAMYNEGTLATKEGKRLTKDLEKLHKNQVKLQERLTDASSKKTKTENALLKKEEVQIKLEAQYNAITARKNKYESERDKARSDLDKTTMDLQDEKREMEVSLQTLESLKNAKSGISTL